MHRKTKRTLTALVAIAALGGGAAIAAAGGGDDDATEKPISGPALERAKAAALQHTGGGRVTATEAGDEEGAYEVEVTRAGGKQVDVHLNRKFEVLGAADDGEGDGPGDD